MVRFLPPPQLARRHHACRAFFVVADMDDSLAFVYLLCGAFAGFAFGLTFFVLLELYDLFFPPKD